MKRLSEDEYREAWKWANRLRPTRQSSTMIILEIINKFPEVKKNKPEYITQENINWWWAMNERYGGEGEMVE